MSSNSEFGAMQQYVDLVGTFCLDLEKCRRMHIWVQKSASIQLQTSSLKLAVQLANNCTYTSYLAPRNVTSFRKDKLSKEI